MYQLSRESCSIDMGDQVIITGGLWMAATRVTVYNSLGFVADWPSLKIGRVQHGCGHFVNTDNNVVGAWHLLFGLKWN